MGDVARVLSECNNVSLQTLMHDRLAMEACENIHLHWRNVRLEMSLSDAGRLVGMCAAFERLALLLAGNIVTLPLKAICPYDQTHKRISDDEFENESPEATASHKVGIAWVVEQMKTGRKPWPIAVCPAWHSRFPSPEDWRPGNVWQRLDGFKRYMAHRVLGLTQIDCFMFSHYEPGCQHGHRAFQDPGEDLPRALTRDLFLAPPPRRLSIVEIEEQRCKTNEVELLRNGTVHVHLGDTRLEFEQSEFLAVAEMLRKAAIALREPSVPSPSSAHSVVDEAAL